MWSTWSSYLLDNPNPAAAMLSVRRELTSVSISFQWSLAGAISDELFKSSLTALLRCRLLWDSGLCTTAKLENRNALRNCRAAAIFVTNRHFLTFSEDKNCLALSSRSLSHGVKGCRLETEGGLVPHGV